MEVCSYDEHSAKISHHSARSGGMVSTYLVLPSGESGESLCHGHLKRLA